MTTNKPPMTLYFRENVSNVYMDGSHMDNRFGQAFANRRREADVGPYVHMEQFMEEVERRLALWKTLEIAGESEPITDKHYKQAALMIAKEIMEGEG